ncbi:hypothetical protein [Curtobacterium sp. VKM Ac-1393]|uniref:hypothetical protein n=1 Tax=Curtobacterium sp. VKM Ac-1393 TaxID=2783814 RepID=UPI00188D78CD|nr:hypothetical protein [Curtobacterium sp. VKM Ac-1393]MBF4606898.1 hypothetical protein [Curtobacterium sp. VKM Ac-1393]
MMTSTIDLPTTTTTTHDHSTVYAAPGTSAGIVPLKTRYENFIGGAWLPQIGGDHREDLAPATGEPFAEYAHSTVPTRTDERANR